MNKIILLIVCYLLQSLTLKSQIVFFENFDAISVNNNVGVLPSGWQHYNLDNGIPVSSNAYFGTNAWIVMTNASAQGNKWAAANSRYTGFMVANDWLVTPAITVPSVGQNVLQFDVKSNKEYYEEDYEVYISTTGNSVADFNNPPIFRDSIAYASSYIKQSLNIAAYNGQTIYIAFRQRSYGKDKLYLDNVTVKTIQSNDAYIAGLECRRFIPTNFKEPLKIKIGNTGNTVINSVTIDWSNGVSHSAVISGLNILPNDTFEIIHPDSLLYSIVLEDTIGVSVSHVNGILDPEMSGNTKTIKVNTVGTAARKYLLFEESTGTWCGPCIRGIVAMEAMSDTILYPNFIGVTVHSSDPMENLDYKVSSQFNFLPQCHVDRISRNLFIPEANDLEIYYTQQSNIIAPASVALSKTYDTITRNLSATVTAKFNTVFSNCDLRLAVILSEDSVNKPFSGYNQNNPFSGSLTPVGGFELLANPVPASDMYYRHVGRELLGGYSGAQNSVPSSISNGQSIAYTFNANLPSFYNSKKVHLIGLLIDQINGEVLNAYQIKLDNTSPTVVPTTVEDLTNLQFSKIQLLPNPVHTQLALRFNSIIEDQMICKFTDAYGRLVLEKIILTTIGFNQPLINVADLGKGIYTLSIKSKMLNENKRFAVSN